MKLLSDYNPNNRYQLLKSLIGLSIKEIKRYFNSDTNLDDRSNEASLILEGSNLLSLSFSNDRSVDFSGYFPRYVEVKVTKSLDRKYAVSPDRNANRSYPMIVYSDENYYSTKSINDIFFKKILNEEIINISILAESTEFLNDHSPSLHSLYRGVVFHLSNTSFAVGLGIIGKEYSFNLALDFNVLNNKYYVELPLPQYDIPVYLLPYLNNDTTLSLYVLEVDDLVNWKVGDLSTLKEEITRVNLDLEQLKNNLLQLDALLKKENIGILDFSISINLQSGDIFLAGPFDVVQNTLKENELFIMSIISNLD